MEAFRWTPAGLRRLTVGLIVIGSGLAAGPAVSFAFGPSPFFHDSPAASLVVGLSTAGWAWILCRCLLALKSTWHFLWLAPTFGALNAGTSFALLTSGEGLGAMGGAFLLGTLFGIPVGGTLGLGFGAVVAVLIGYYRRLVGKETSDASLRLLSVGAAWMTAVAVVTHAFAAGLATNVADCEWCTYPIDVAVASMAARSIATGLAVWTLLLHGRALHWMNAVRSGAISSHAVIPAAAMPGVELPRLAEAPSKELLVLRKEAGSGPFRSGDARAPLSYVADAAELRRRTLLVGLVTVTVLVTWWI